MQNKVRNVKEAIFLFRKELNEYYEASEIRAIIALLFEHLLGFSQTDLLTKDDYELNDSHILYLNDALTRMKKHEPIQYIIGYTHFCDHKFIVNSSVLIPRPETEEIVQHISSIYSAEANFSLLDIGTGSGCIPISIALNHKNALIHAVDISEEALQVASLNALKNLAKVIFSREDILNASPGFLNEKFDVIVSNPPYIPFKEKYKMGKNVLAFEPELALFVKDDEPFIFYEQIARLSKDMLTAKGFVLCEINEFHSRETKEVFVKAGFKQVQILNDMFDKARMVKASQ
jgi:release factor glutamine methyltransferase